MKLKTKINRFNDWFAIFLAKKLIGNMWCAYCFFLYSLLGLVLPDYIAQLTFWSNSPQLWLLPVLLVSANLLDKANERRQKETHDMVKAEFEIIKQVIKKIDPDYILETKKRNSKEVNHE